MSLKTDDQHARRIADAICQAAKLGGDTPKAEAVLEAALDGVLQDMLSAHRSRKAKGAVGAADMLWRRAVKAGA